MKTFKRILLVILLMVVVAIAFRGWAYRSVVTYKSTGERTSYLAKDARLIDYIENSADGKDHSDIKQIAKLSLSITAAQLNFTAAKNDNKPNRLINSRSAHCVGYAAFYATTANHLLEKNSLSGTWTAKPQIGQLYILGLNLHSLFSHPFFRDHDFVTIENRMTGETFAVDPSIYDYLFVDFVTHTHRR